MQNHLFGPLHISAPGPKSGRHLRAAAARRVHSMSLQKLLSLAPAPMWKKVRNWWLSQAERHYLICADVEQQRAREAHMNVAYYQKRAALARSARND